MQFRVLGAVEAVEADQPVDLGHARVRCVLAVLLIDANRVVPTDQLIERAWGQNPPRSRNVLYSYISRLRTALATDPASAIQRRSGGYQLTTDAQSVDVHRFRILIKDAESADDDAHAMALFEAALQLWRGTPFAGLDTPWLATAREELELDRQIARLDRNDAALRCRQHTRLLAELNSLASTHPLDERIAGQLIFALAAAGRTAEALAAYQRTRRALVDQLGVEPGTELRDVHERVLTGDTDPIKSVPVETLSVLKPDVVRPFQVPADTARFMGRTKYLDSLLTLGDDRTHGLGDPDQARHHWQVAADLLTTFGIDDSEPGLTIATIGTHLHALDNPPAPV